MAMTMTMIEANLIASIYEASAIPEKWPEALAKVAASCAASGSIMICADRGFDRHVAATGFQHLVDEFAASEWAADNARIGNLMEVLPHPGFVTDTMLHSEDDLKKMPIFRDFFIPKGIGSGAATVIYGASNDGIILTIEGFENHAKARSSVEYLNALRPHLARASMLSWQLSMKQAQAAVDALGLIGNPAATIGKKGQVLVTNRLFDDLIDIVFSDASSRLSAKDRQADHNLKEALNELLQQGNGKSIAMPNPETGMTNAMHLLPVTGEVHDVFQGASGLIVLARSDKANLPPTDLLESLFDLTPAEAAIGRKIAASKSLREIAAEQDVSVETVRWHLKNLMMKTGTRKQSQLIMLITGQALPS